jgi:hypothetical protein
MRDQFASSTRILPGPHDAKDFARPSRGGTSRFGDSARRLRRSGRGRPLARAGATDSTRATLPTMKAAAASCLFTSVSKSCVVTVTEMQRTMLTKTVEPRTRHKSSVSAVSAVVLRVESEYLEMPGLKLTEAQARRLWGLDGNTCRVVLATLMERGFLRRSGRNMYIRVTE